MEEPHLAFRKAVQKITESVGGNMEAFFLGVVVKKKFLPAPPSDPGKAEEKAVVWFTEGEIPNKVMVLLEGAISLAEFYTQQTRDEKYLGVEILKADILKGLLAREKARRP